MASVPEGAGCPEVGKELVAEAHHKVPDVSSHLWPCNENAPDDHKEGGVECISDIPQSEKRERHITEEDKSNKNLNSLLHLLQIIF